MLICRDGSPIPDVDKIIDSEIKNSIGPTVFENKNVLFHLISDLLLCIICDPGEYIEKVPEAYSSCFIITKV